MPRRLGARPAGSGRSLIRRRQGRNTYRRGRFRGERRGWWWGLSFISLGIMGVSALGVGMLLLYYQLLTCSWFCIKDMEQIEIEGLRRLKPAVILEQARLTAGISLMALKPGWHEQALMEHPWIARAELTRRWPNRLLVEIQEREPVALVQMGELYYVDRQGRLCKPLSPGDPHDFPVITGLSREDFALERESASTALTQVFQLLDLLKTTPPPLNVENISEVHVDHEHGFTLYAKGLISAVDLGRCEWPAQLEKFARVWPVLVQRGYHLRVKRINLDYPQRVLLSFGGGGEK